MVDPILLLVVPLAVAFSLPLVDKIGRWASRGLHILTLAFMAVVTGQWWLALYQGHKAAQIITGGWNPPWGINLRLGLNEASLVFLAASTGIASAIYLIKREDRAHLRGLIIQLMVVVGATGLIMTRDLFNIFVFLEITSIGTYALVGYGREKGALEAGFKYMVLGSIASILLLLSIGVLYKWTGTLNLDDMVGRISGVQQAGLGLALLLLLVTMAAELKLFPLNGPGVDLYDAVEPGVMALLVGTTVNALAFTFYKVFALYDTQLWTTPVMAIGALTFVVANFVATRQKRLGRTLGYSSSAQLGLLVFFVPLVYQGLVPLWAVGLLLVNHSLAKAGLLWLSGIQGGRGVDAWGGLRRFSGIYATHQRLALLLLVLAITALPPMPGFFGKWFALTALVKTPYIWWLWPILLGSMFEFVYYFNLLRSDDNLVSDETNSGVCPLPEAEGFWPVLFSLGALALGGWLLHSQVETIHPVLWLGAGLGLLLLASYQLQDKLPKIVPALISLAGLSALAAWAWQQGMVQLDSVSGIFSVIILLGALLIALVALAAPELDGRHHANFVFLVLALLLITGAKSLLLFFIGWELMTWTSYLLITHGKRAGRASYLYILFSTGAGLLVLAGLLVAVSAGVDSIAGLNQLAGTKALVVWSLLVLGFATKVAAWGLHIWAPAAYSEAPDSFTAFLSSVISKMPVFGLVALVARIGLGHDALFFHVIDPYHLLAWIGALGAFSMSLWAVFQDDVKKMFAYSSLGQLGYIIVGFALMTPLGWNAALFHSVHHFLFKALLFLVIAGVIRRVGTRNFHEMGGLIENMPRSYIGMLIGIITLSGVSPLAGFIGKWLIYQAVLDKGWLLLTAFLMFSSLVAFLYLYRSIHGIFLGQRKKIHRQVKEAPLPYGLAQVVLMGLIMAISIFPNLVLAPMQGLIRAQFGASSLDFSTATLLAGKAGHFNALAMMVIVGVLFAYALVVLLIANPKAKRVKQLDVVSSAELPPNPEEFHFVADMFRPYERAFCPVLGHWGVKLWDGIAEWAAALANGLRRIYTGDAQTYLLYPIILIVILVASGVGR